MKAMQAAAELRAQRAALEAEVAELRATLARLETRLSRDEMRKPRASSYFWGLMFGLLALAMAAGWLYYGFMHVMSLD
jgi:type VI protein secretion system component VasF